MFNRRSTVGLAGKLGEIRLGRDYTPTFISLATSMHPIGTVGVGNSGQLFYPRTASGTTPRTFVRASNAINYILPSGLGGIYGNFMYAMGEQPSNAAGGTKDDGTYVGGRVGYAAGPLNLAAATGKTQYATADYTQSNFGINYQLGSVKLMYLWGQNRIGSTRTTVQLVGTRWTVGSSELRAAYTALKAENIANDATQIALQYVYSLSKRTSIYANYSKVSNKDRGTAFVVGTGNAVRTPGGSSSGVDFGITHSF
jgi:predicted porin